MASTTAASTKKPKNESDRLRALQRLQVLDTPAEEAFDALTQLTADIFNVPIALVSLVDAERQWFKSRHGVCVEETARDISFCTNVVNSEAPLVVNDATLDPRFADSPLVINDPHLVFYAGVPLREPNGYVIGTLCINDTQARTFSDDELSRLTLLGKQAEQLIKIYDNKQSLKQQQQRTDHMRANYQAIAEGSAAGIVKINQRGTILEINRYLSIMLGYSADELIGSNVKVLMPGRWAHEHDCYLTNYINTGEQQIIGKGREVEALHKDGHPIPVHLSVAEVEHDHSDRHFIGILSDLSEIHFFREQERFERELLYVLHDGLTDYRALLSGNTLWTFLEEALKRLTESKYALIGEVVANDANEPTLKIHAITDLSWNDDSRNLMQDLVAGNMMLSRPDTMLGKVFAGGEIIRNNDMIKHAAKGALPKGHPQLTCYLGVPIYDNDEVIGMYAIANAKNGYSEELVEALKPFTSTCSLLINLYRQLNQERSFTEELSKAKALAESANQAKTEFLSSMSHELRTPLNAIIGFAQLIQSSKNQDATKRQKHLQQIVKSGQHLLELINEVLDLSRIESGKMNLVLEPIRARDVITEVIDLITPLAEAQGINIILPPNKPCEQTFLGDYVRVKQVLINLLNNAVKYNRPNGTIHLRCYHHEGTFGISIKDSGIGIDPERIPELFKPFNRLGAEASSVEGTGVGLALSHKLVRLMGGKIGVESSLHNGSEFWVEFPSNYNAETEQPTPTNGAVISVGELFKQASITILYIHNDSETYNTIMKSCRFQNDITLLGTSSVEQGIEMACSESPTIILIDIELVKVDGFDVLAILKRNPLTRAVNVVALSSQNKGAGSSTHDTESATHFLHKPVDGKTIIASLAAVLKEGSRDVQ